ncbi:MAG: glycine cleavage system aminomethyltransferase GcvT [Anaerohalosphaeraceae bacterium]|nr:glycine cleavage system aminomethyltransferase GcvT [Anaerohalosphaeraceae bacterium]
MYPTKSQKFEFESPVLPPQTSALYRKHTALAAKSRIVPFAGYLMPLWYSSIAAEHSAVREKAGLFDCTHMGVLGFKGDGAEWFLNVLATNEVTALVDGKAQYSYILDTAGNILDDIIVYRKKANDFMVVVNAANESKIKAWLPIVKDYLGATTEQLEIIDLKDSANPQAKVDLALQGPASAECLSKITGEKTENIKPFTFIKSKIDGVEVIISATGYTGAKTAFEIFVHPAKAPAIWDRILETGASDGIVPCGLGARDSLRIQAGFPLYGHELAGELNISPFAAGYRWAVKLKKEFFIGQDAIRQTAESFTQQVSRIELPGQKGIRPAREADGILDSQGLCIGSVLSCAGDGKNQIAMALINKAAATTGNDIGLYYLARSQSQLRQGKKDCVNLGEKLTPDIQGRIVSRFEKF